MIWSVDLKELRARIWILNNNGGFKTWMLPVQWGRFIEITEPYLAGIARLDERAKPDWCEDLHEGSSTVAPTTANLRL